MAHKETKEVLEKALSKAEREIYLSLKKKLYEGKSLSAIELEQYQELSSKIEATLSGTPQSEDKFLWRLKEVADFFDVSKLTVNSWEKFTDFDKTAKLGPGLYDIRKMFRWWYNHFVANEQSLIEIQEARRRKEVAQAEMKELEAKELKGELLRKSQVVDDLAYCIEIFKRRLTSLPKTIPPVVAMQDERTIQKLLHKEVNDILNDLSNNIESLVLTKKKEIKHR